MPAEAGPDDMSYSMKRTPRGGLRVAAIATATVTALGGLLLTPAAATAAPPDACRCAALQRDLDAYRRGEVQYFVDPVPAWTKEAARHGCNIRGLDRPGTLQDG
ncbi:MULTISPECIES: hypothetical protein [unclassified Streptomyces]|uniref:hypothetical protein n=1 Tax=unclassified Streptomyces TaxID=2593676 RepID=UPI002E0E097C|nr:MULTISPECIES: hypothetical protein [unclassified Streptomyces]WSR23840.1 hypothetical protein OG573_35460 [Streptomyces sp. NBC_01205]